MLQAAGIEMSFVLNNLLIMSKCNARLKVSASLCPCPNPDKFHSRTETILFFPFSAQRLSPLLIPPTHQLCLDSKFFWHHGSAPCPTKDGHVGQRREQISQMPFPIGQDAVDEDSILSSGKQRSLRLGAIKIANFSTVIY